MAEPIIAPFAQDILRNLLQILADETKLAWGYKGEVKKLEKRLEMALAFLSDAESKSLSSDTMKVWLRNLKGAVNDAATVLDEFRYEALRQEIEVQGRFKNKVTDFFSSCNNPIAFRLKLAHKVKNVNLLLDDVKKDAIGMGLEEKIISAPPQPIDIPPRSTSPGVDIKSVVGREKDVSVIAEQLLSFKDDEDLPVISICGMGGLGKTTLAHLVRMDERVARHFGAQILITVSTNFQVTRLLDQMVQSLTKENKNLSNDGAIIEILSEELKGKSYLLVLDDVWNTNPVDWKSMRDALLGIRGSTGGKILVTCRDKKVASTMQSSFTLDLERLSSEDGWALFRHKAFANGGPIETEEFMEIGKDIVSRCGGVPLAIDVLGSLMYSKKSKDEWLAVRDNKSLSLEENLNFVQNILKFSYDHLTPSSLKSCFAFMSILPKDSHLRKDFFIQLWMALGLLSPPKRSNFNLEDVGNEYFDLLLAKSLLQEPMIDAYGNIKHCKMHDLVHDLALRTSEGYCLTLCGSDEVRDIPDNVIHLCLISPTTKQIDLAGRYFQKIQTLIFHGRLTENIVIELKCLRILVLEGYETEELTPSIGKLKHLRFLDISETSIKTLPSSLTKLYNLQTLSLGDNYMYEFPKRFGDLVSLRHIYGGGVIAGVGKLTSLQTLSLFKVSRDRGCLVGDLGGLEKLKGKLCIRGLGEVENKVEARRAKLLEKSKLQALEFEWDREENEDCFGADEDVLEGLRPHPELKSLKIVGFKGVKLPRWMTSESFTVLKKLVEIELKGCERCEEVPTLGHLPSLKKVYMVGLKVRKIGESFYGYGGDTNRKIEKMETCFPALRELVLMHMGMLEEWVDGKHVYHQSSSSPSSSLVVNKATFQFPKLEKLEIMFCGKLMVVPSEISSSLKELKLWNVGNSGVGVGVELQKMPRGLTCLTSLSLINVNCMEVGSVLEELFNNNSTSLTEVDIIGCDQLIEMGEGVFKDCMALKTLRIRSCSNIKVVPDVGGLISLTYLEITDCGALKGLPRGIETLTSLQDLSISGSSVDDDSIPRLPTSLRHLWLSGFPNIKELPQQQLGCLSALQSLYLKNMEGLEALPDWLHDLCSLQTLYIDNCNNLKSMPTPQATSHLKYLYIIDCPVLKERCVKGSGIDWQNIQHIPNIEIDNQNHPVNELQLWNRVCNNWRPSQSQTSFRISLLLSSGSPTGKGIK